MRCATSYPPASCSSYAGSSVCAALVSKASMQDLPGVLPNRRSVAYCVASRCGWYVLMYMPASTKARADVYSRWYERTRFPHLSRAATLHVVVQSRLASTQLYTCCAICPRWPSKSSIAWTCTTATAGTASRHGCPSCARTQATTRGSATGIATPGCSLNS